MIGLDTNVLARYIVRDDTQQTAAATRLLQQYPEDSARKSVGNVGVFTGYLYIGLLRYEP